MRARTPTDRQALDRQLQGTKGHRESHLAVGGDFNASLAIRDEDREDVGCFEHRVDIELSIRHVNDLTAEEWQEEEIRQHEAIYA